MVNRSQLKFHETFQPEAGYISKILELANDSYSGDKFQISEITGIPTGNQKGKVEPHIKYASFMGLVEYSVENGVYQLTLSDLGTLVFKEDKYLHEQLTRWICHYRLSCENGAPQWNYLIHKANQGFNIQNSSQFYLDKASDFFSTKISFEELFGVVKRSYTDGFFGDLNYLKWAFEMQVEHFLHQEHLFAYAYSLLDSWDKLYPDRQELTLIEINSGIGIGRIYNFSNETIDDVLDMLSNEGIISVNRQLNPITVIRLVTTEFAMNRIYSRLL